MPKAKPAPKRKAANGYKLAEPLPLGQILRDVTKKEWKLGPSIGQGGFGEIYSAKAAESKGTQYPYVIKIEPHGNGPLFVEMHFYMRNAKLDDVEAFKKKKGLKTFGMPLYLGSGSHEYNGEKYRFIVMEKFGSDFWKIFLENNRNIPSPTVFKLAVQILDVLEYIHSKGYVHADIKGANILMGITKETNNKQCYLVDFGLACKRNDDVDFKPNPKKAHDGTIEYLSRDAHLGVQTRRGDLEILAYNIIQWLGCVLPWEQKLSDPNSVQKLKEEHMSNLSTFMKTCFGKKSPPGPLLEFLKYLSTLKHNSVPDYKKIRKIFISGLDSKDGLDRPFNFSVKTKTSKNISPIKRKNDLPNLSPKRRKNEICESSDEKENLDDDDDDDDEEIVPVAGISSSRPKLDNSNKKSKKRTNKTTKSQTANDEQEEDNSLNFKGYTDAMKEVLKRKMKKQKATEIKKTDPAKNDMEGFTDSMKEIALKKKEKLAKKGSK